jgi:4-hydroxy-tetrahydrodipicolinate reductase
MTEKPLKIGIVGKGGRMGQSIQMEISQNSDFSLIHTLEDADILIDFSTPEATKKSAKLAQKYSIPLVIGTTGLGESELEILREGAKVTPILHSNNMSLGMATFKSLVVETAKKLGDDVTIEIIETHHIHKIDAPSGTAISLKEALPNPVDVKISSLREGEVFGEHIVKFSNDHEVIELKHTANGREIFAQGALKAALWLQGKPSGFYTLDDMLNPP